jgi:hypothetical protein
MERIEEVLTSVTGLLQDIKNSDDTLTLGESHHLYSKIREAEGWLMSARNALEPNKPPMPKPLGLL